ncbi:MAG: VanZ family protein [Lachnospiraceae bacterium]|jgi:glycopeptide antibiotics resistance protein|nr:VanZ family protein [Lachnospiraceae bacterium]MCH4031896.1 VanZ family protein [Lachnospiraceae bacterium]MCH4070520.1 VanZ family protein [Lachnospiraceae bacterium]MCH4109187.1 VanZ family protein [Lachnospiraceae bacterium]MCI1332537.1 VanZ family protein [Lachnospiraceae bacterium]
MQIYLETISEAAFVFPVLALLITLPYMLVQYHRYGAVLALRTAIVYSFVFYLLTSFFLTLLPLPDPSTLTHNAPVYLKLFHEVDEWKQQTGFVFGDSSTYQIALKNRVLWEMIFNVALLFPFGVYLHYYFRRSFLQTLLLSFLYSLFFEVTQLTGVYHIYPYSYRTFDVDDLFFNTLGGVLGFIMTPLFSFALPSRKALDEESVQKSGRITVMRRAAAFAVDAILVYFVLNFIVNQFGVTLALPGLDGSRADLSEITNDLKSGAWRQAAGTFTTNTLWPLLQILLPGMCLILTLTESITGGYTLGKWLVRMRLRGRRGGWPNPLRILLRNAILYLLILPAPFYFTMVFKSLSAQASDSTSANLALLAASAFLVLFFYQVGNAVHCSAKEEADYRYDRIAGLHMMNTTRGSRRSRVRNAARDEAKRQRPAKSYKEEEDPDTGKPMGDETRMLDSMSDEELEEELQRIKKNKKRSGTGNGASAPAGRAAEDEPERYTADDIDIVDDIKAWEAGGVLPEEDTVPGLGRQVRRFSGGDENAEEPDGLDDLDQDDIDQDDWDKEDLDSDEMDRDTQDTRKGSTEDKEEGAETRILNSMSDEELEEELEAIEKDERKADRKAAKRANGRKKGRGASRGMEDWEIRDDRSAWEKRNRRR